MLAPKNATGAEEWGGEDGLVTEPMVGSCRLPCNGEERENEDLNICSSQHPNHGRNSCHQATQETIVHPDGIVERKVVFRLGRMRSGRKCLRTLRCCQQTAVGLTLFISLHGQQEES